MSLPRNADGFYELKLRVMRPFVPLYQHEARPFREYIFYGGRFGGKNFAISQYCCIRALRKKTRILVLREFATSGRGSVYTDIKDFYETYEIEAIASEIDIAFNKSNLFVKYRADRISLANGSEFIFAGINDNVVDGLKGLKDIDICWLDEANFITEYAYAKLEPTIRAANSCLIFSFNPENAEEFIYQKAINNKNPRVYVAKCNAVALVNYEVNAETHRLDRSKCDVIRLNKFLNDTNFASIIDHLDLYTEQMWRHHYLGEPADVEDGNIIPTHLFGTFNNHDLPKFVEVLITADTAFSVKESADYSAILVAGVTLQNELCILRVIRARLEFHALQATLMAQYEWAQNLIHLPPVIIIEQKASGMSLTQELRRTTHLAIREVVPKKDKFTRVSSVLQEFARVRLPIYKDGEDWQTDFLRELRAFRADGTHLHDDQVDALYYALEYTQQKGTSASVWEMLAQ